jgi:hypothetical protein
MGGALIKLPYAMLLVSDCRSTRGFEPCNTISASRLV